MDKKESLLKQCDEAKKEAAQYENQVKILLNKQRDAERHARNHRLIVHGAIILGAFETLLAAIAPLVETISNGLLWAYENVLLPLASWTIETAIPETLNFFAEAFGKLNKVWENVKTTATTVWTTIKETLSGIWDNIEIKVKTVFNSVKETVIGVFEKIKDGIKAPINAALGFIEKMVNGVIRGVNALLGWMNTLKIDVPEGVPFVGGMHLGFNFDLLKDVEIPRLAKGGILDKGQLFIAREAGPELVGKIGKNSAVANNLQILEGIKQGVYEGVLAANKARSIVAELEIPSSFANVLRDIEPAQPQYVQRQNPYATVPAQFTQAQAAATSISNYSTTTTTNNVTFGEDRIISAMGACFKKLIEAVNANGDRPIKIDGRTLVRAVDKTRREMGANIMGGSYDLTFAHQI